MRAVPQERPPPKPLSLFDRRNMAAMLVTKKLKYSAGSSSSSSLPEHPLATTPNETSPTLSAIVRAARNVSLKLHARVIRMEATRVLTS